VDELLESLDPGHGEEVQEEEFMLIMKYIQQKRPSQLPEIVDKSLMSNHSVIETERKKYGALLPKVGVYFLPDDKVLGLLK
jgi:hypothetical protein